MTTIQMIEREFLKPDGLSSCVQAVVERLVSTSSFTWEQSDMIRVAMTYTNNVELRKAFVKGLVKMAQHSLKGNSITPERLQDVLDELILIASN